MRVISAKEARQHFADIINEVYYGNQKIVVSKSGRPMVILTSAKSLPKNTNKIAKHLPEKR